MRILQIAAILLLTVPAFGIWSASTNTTVAVTDPVVSLSGETVNIRAFSDLLQQKLVEKKAFRMVERTFLMKVLEERKLELSGLTENDSTKIGALSGADKVFVSSITKVDKRYYLTVKALDTRSGQVDFIASADAMSQSLLLAQVPALADRLARLARGETPGVTAAPAGSGIPADGLTLWLPCDKNTDDKSPAGNHAVAANAVSVTNRFGEARGAYLFRKVISYLYTEQAVSNPFPVTLSVWFSTESMSGGRILGFSDSVSDMSDKKDRHIYMDRAGRVCFGVYDPYADKVTIRSRQSFNDGDWHHAAAVFSTNGLALYVDGTAVSTTNSVTSAVPYNGYWRAGYDMMNQWPGEPDSYSFYGMMDDIRVYRRELSAPEIRALYTENGWPRE